MNNYSLGVACPVASLAAALTTLSVLWVLEGAVLAGLEHNVPEAGAVDSNVAPACIGHPSEREQTKGREEEKQEVVVELRLHGTSYPTYTSQSAQAHFFCYPT